MIYADLAMPVLAAVLVITVPGLLLSWAAGARGWVLAASAGPLSVSVIALTAIFTGVTGMRWSLQTVLLVCFVLAAVIFMLRWLPWGRSGEVKPSLAASDTIKFASVERRSVDRAGLRTGWFAVLAVFTVLYHHTGAIFGDSGNISQTFDNVFHLNAVRYIAETGNASSLLVSGFTSTTGVGGFYPAAWHDVVSLTHQMTGSTIAVAVNASNVAIAALIWPLSCIILAVAIFGQRRLVVASAAALAAGFSSFPYLMLDFGVLYPNLLSIALLPAGIGLLALALRVARGLRPSSVTAWTLMIGTLPGLALAHPSTLMALLAWTYPVVSLACVRMYRRYAGAVGHWRSGGLALLGVVIYTSALLFAWDRLRPDETQAGWQPVQSVAQAFGEALASAPNGRPVPWMILALTLVGIWALLHHRHHFWLLGIFGISCIAYIVVSGFPAGEFRTWLGGIWYNDPNRLAALLPVAALPVAVMGTVWLADTARRRAAVMFRWAGARNGAGSAAIIVVAFVALTALTQGGSVRAAVASAAGSYALNPDSWLVDSQEMTLLERAAGKIPADNKVVASPWTGASMVYAVSGRKALTPHIFSEFGDDTRTVLHRLNQAGEDPNVCESVRRLKAFYVLDFGTREVHNGSHEYPGLTGLSKDPDFELIDSEGDAKLYKVGICSTE